MKLLMKFKKDTKGAQVYTEVNEEGKEYEYGQYKVGTLYIRKTAMPSALPMIQVTIEPHQPKD